MPTPHPPAALDLSGALDPSAALDRPGAIRTGEELDLVRLAAFLRLRFPEQPAAIHADSLDVRQYPSGHSNLTYSVRFAEREFVLRRPPFGSKVKSAHDMGREFRVLSRLHDVFPQAPRVLFFSDDESVLGAPFYAMEPIRGIILRSKLPPGLDLSPGRAAALSAAFVDNLVRLHGVDFQAAGLADLGRPQGFLERQVRGWTERYENAKTHVYPEVEPLTEWLQSALPETTAVSLIHNDYKYDNLVLDASDLTRITGLLDWEMCTLGDSLADLGTALAYWVDRSDPPELQARPWGPTALPGSYTRAEVVERYAAQTGVDVSAIAFYLAFARFKLAVIVQQIYFRFHQGLTHDERFRPMAETAASLIRSALHCAETGKI